MIINPQVAAQIARGRFYPVEFVQREFGVTPDMWQAEALEAFVSEDKAKSRIALSACAGPGKSAVLAWCGWIFISCYCGDGEHPKGAVISCTKDTLMDTLWPEFSKWQKKSKYLSSAFTWTSSKIYANDHPETWFLTARSYPKTANEEELGRTLSGLHSDYIAYFIDESGDTSVQVLKSANQGLTRCKFGKIMTAGNPTSHHGLLYHAVKENPDSWHVITITGDPDNPKRSTRIDIDEARASIELWGRDDPWVMAYVLGEFPKTSIDTLLSPDEVREAIARGQATDLNHEMYKYSQKRLGVDVALMGDDFTAIVPRQGLRVFKPKIFRESEPSDVAAIVLQAKKAWGSELEFIDVTGPGGPGVMNYCRDGDGDPVAVNYSKKPGEERYYNNRALMYFRLRHFVRNGGILPNYKKFIKGLSCITYTRKNGKIILEPKAQIKVKLKRSPDEEDALAQTFFYPDQPGKLSSIIPELNSLSLNNNDRQSSDWDVYADM